MDASQTFSKRRRIENWRWEEDDSVEKIVKHPFSGQPGIKRPIELQVELQNQCEVSRFCADSANRIAVSARNYIPGCSSSSACARTCGRTRPRSGARPWRCRGSWWTRAGRSPAGRGRCWLQNDYPVGDVLGGLAAVPAVGPAAPVFSGGPGAKVAMGATSMGPAVLGRVGRLVPLVLGRLALLDLSEWLLA
ncbi:hypothetical protein MTO96_025586 [Rhipicephalus appendiculatus]